MPLLRPIFAIPAACAALAALAVTPAPADTVPSALDAVQQSKTLRVCTTGDYKPFTYQAPGGTGFEGIDIDLGRSLATALGAEATFVKTSWPTLMADFTSGRCDIGMGGISVSLERQKRASFSIPYIVNGKTPIARCADQERFATVAGIDQPGVRVIVNPGGTNERFTRANIKQANIEVFPDNRTIFDQIAEGKADVMITEAIETILQSRHHPGVLCAVHPDKPFQYSEQAYLLPRGDQTFKDFVDQWLHLAKVSGEFGRVYDQHMQ